MITASDRELVKRCLETYYARCPQMLPGVPPEMQRGTSQEEGDDWVEWKLVTSRLAENDVLELESELPYQLPPLFRAFLVTYYVLDLDFGDFVLPSLPSDAPLKHVRQYLLQPDLWQIGYAPFATNPYGDPVCFDLTAPTPEGDFAVVVINHDNITSQQNWRHRERVQPHATRVANSFREFFTHLCLGANNSQSP